jgi:hypothetical protein
VVERGLDNARLERRAAHSRTRRPARPLRNILAVHVRRPRAPRAAKPALISAIPAPALGSYTGRLDALTKDVAPLMAMADYYDVPQLKQACGAFVARAISQTNVCLLIAQVCDEMISCCVQSAGRRAAAHWQSHRRAHAAPSAGDGDQGAAAPQALHRVSSGQP